MNAQDWEILLATSTALAALFLPWMLMVHGKLAVLCEQSARLAIKVEELIEIDRLRLPRCQEEATIIKEHARRLDAMEATLNACRAAS